MAAYFVRFTADGDAFRAALRAAASLADEASVVILTAVPTRPEPDFGYVELEPQGGRVSGFTEKPRPEQARRLTDSGRHFWNAGIFVFRPSRLLAEARRVAGDLVRGVAAYVASGAPADYEALPNISIDYAVMEKAADVRAVSLDAGWSDVGTWRSVRELRGPSDAAGNLVLSPVPVIAPGIRDTAIVVGDGGVRGRPFEREGAPGGGRHGARRGTPTGGARLPMNAPALTLSKLRENIALAYRGEPRAVDLLLTALLARGHVLIEDVPGVGKTTLARALGRSLSLDFRRIQFTSDTLPADVIGISVFHAPADRFEFHPGPIFANVVLADEINRATPKTQSALLEAMNEGVVTVETDRRVLPQPFMVVATQNPVEYLGTYPLPESQMDRFFLRLSLGYPSERRNGCCCGGAARNACSRRFRRFWVRPKCSRCRTRRSRSWSRHPARLPPRWCARRAAPPSCACPCRPAEPRRSSAPPRPALLHGEASPRPTTRRPSRRPSSRTASCRSPRTGSGREKRGRS